MEKLNLIRNNNEESISENISSYEEEELGTFDGQTVSTININENEKQNKKINNNINELNIDLPSEVEQKNKQIQLKNNKFSQLVNKPIELNKVLKRKQTKILPFKNDQQIKYTNKEVEDNKKKKLNKWLNNKNKLLNYLRNIKEKKFNQFISNFDSKDGTVMKQIGEKKYFLNFYNLDVFKNFKTDIYNYKEAQDLIYRSIKYRYYLRNFIKRFNILNVRKIILYNPDPIFLVGFLQQFKNITIVIDDIPILPSFLQYQPKNLDETITFYKGWVQNISTIRFKFLNFLTINTVNFKIDPNREIPIIRKLEESLQQIIHEMYEGFPILVLYLNPYKASYNMAIYEDSYYAANLLSKVSNYKNDVIQKIKNADKNKFIAFKKMLNTKMFTYDYNETNKKQFPSTQFKRLKNINNEYKFKHKRDSRLFSNNNHKENLLSEGKNKVRKEKSQDKINKFLKNNRKIDSKKTNKTRLNYSVINDKKMKNDVTNDGINNNEVNKPELNENEF
jgi:hypothetical protein